ncbi:MAG TPA: DNA polymerase III subunit delta [Deltaproteobacteria bacterium]|nr:DNA polymerase III subunit delta [Deltaproteobacteria bacterium]
MTTSRYVVSRSCIMEHNGQREGQTLLSVLDDIKNGRCVSCYLLYGDEEFRIKEALNRIIDALLPSENRDFNLFLLDGDRTDFDAICESVMTPPLLPGRKVIAVTNSPLFASQASLPDIVKSIISSIDKDPAKAVKAFGVMLHMTGWTLEELQGDGWQRIPDDVWNDAMGTEADVGREKWLPKVLEIAGRTGVDIRPARNEAALFEQILTKGFPDGNYLILTTAFVDKRKKIFKMLAEHGVCLSFSKARGEDELKRLFLQTARDILDKSGKKLTTKAITALGNRTGFDLRETMGAVEALITHAGDAVTIDEDDVENLIEKTKEDSIFDLTAALANRNVQKALKTYRDLVNHGVHHLVVLMMIGREIRMLLQAKLLFRTGLLTSFTPHMTFSQFRHSVLSHLQQVNDQEGVKKRSILGQHPYAMYNVFKHAGNFSYDELTTYMDSIGALDIALKTTGKNPDLLIERLLIEMCRPTTVSGDGVRQSSGIDG